VLVTAHRRESWGQPLCDVAAAIGDVAAARPDAQFIWPLHANPAVRDWVAPAVGHLANVLLTGPAAYNDLVRLLGVADVAVTDSGGIQEEAPALRVPVLVTREVTERQEAVDCGAALLVGTDRQRIGRELTTLLTEPAARAAMAVGYSPYGDGEAGTRTAAAIAAMLGVGSRLADFTGRQICAPLAASGPVRLPAQSPGRPDRQPAASSHR
jgi:UDP-N-acetylglucosamine 2-epimerase (non-hydrolysing)